jgi:transcriptional regulator with XRE-family HTH domain
MTAGERMPDLAEKLNHLFATVPGSGRGGHYSNDTAAEALQDRFGITVSGVHLSHLRAGRRDNPSARLLAALAELFGVPISYFFDSSVEETINADLEMLSAIKDDRIRRLMQRAQGVSPRSLDHLEGILDQIRILEGIDPDPR